MKLKRVFSGLIALAIVLTIGSNVFACTTEYKVHYKGVKLLEKKDKNDVKYKARYTGNGGSKVEYDKKPDTNIASTSDYTTSVKHNGQLLNFGSVIETNNPAIVVCKVTGTGGKEENAMLNVSKTKTITIEKVFEDAATNEDGEKEDVTATYTYNFHFVVNDTTKDGYEWVNAIGWTNVLKYGKQTSKQTIGLGETRTVDYSDVWGIGKSTKGSVSLTTANTKLVVGDNTLKKETEKYIVEYYVELIKVKDEGSCNTHNNNSNTHNNTHGNNNSNTHGNNNVNENGNTNSNTHNNTHNNTHSNTHNDTHNDTHSNTNSNTNSNTHGKNGKSSNINIKNSGNTNVNKNGNGANANINNNGDNNSNSASASNSESSSSSSVVVNCNSESSSSNGSSSNGSSSSSSNLNGSSSSSYVESSGAKSVSYVSESNGYGTGSSGSYSMPKTGETSKTPVVIAGLALILIGGGIFFYKRISVRGF